MFGRVGGCLVDGNLASKLACHVAGACRRSGQVLQGLAQRLGAYRALQ